ncbi:MAG: ATPase P, partial [Candidatus Dadabacteria bacterium]
MNDVEHEEGSATLPKWHARDVAAVARELGVDGERGLSGDEARQRLRQYGLNQLPEGRRIRWYEVLARQYLDPLVGILFIAAALSVAVGELSDAITIAAILILNGALGF